MDTNANEPAAGCSGGSMANKKDDDKHDLSKQDQNHHHHQNHENHPSLESPSSSPENDTEENSDEDRIVKHIMVIGFHHKHGYQVDYCFPPLEPNGPVFSTPTKPIILPACWKTLPLLCLPDGSHNYDSDTIYFTMPGDCTQQNESTTHDGSIKDQSAEQTNSEPDHPRPSSNQTTSKPNAGIKTIFGTACYRQIQADKLLNRTDDMTRITVQKSVCVLSTRPLFGLIRSKLEMITHAYFGELDFSKVKILKLTYSNLNSLLTRDSVKENGIFLGLSARQLISQFGCNTLVLFKAMLLEKKILFYKSPVRDLCSTIMSMCSLFSGLLECGGLDYSTCDLQLSPALLEALKLLAPITAINELDAHNCDETTTTRGSNERDDKVFFSQAKEEVVIISDTNFTCESSTKREDDPSGSSSNLIDVGELRADSPAASSRNATNSGDQSRSHQSFNSASDFEMVPDSNKMEQQQQEEARIGSEDDLDDEISMADDDGSMIDDPQAFKLCRLKPEECGLPLQIFTRGSFCLPYLSISYLDLLSDTRVKSFVIGATNFLFKQRKDMYDVIVDMEENTIIINNSNLKKCLTLTTEDLRFMDYLSRYVKLETSQPKDEFDLISHDITKWVGGDEWIRYHFRLYTLYLLKAAKNPQLNMTVESFNSLFVQTWKQTSNNYNIWDSMGKSALLETMQSKHPFSSTSKGINFSDMKLKLSYAVNSSERGRMINQTLNGIGKWSIWNNIASAAVAATSAASGAAAAAATSNHQADKATNLKQDRK